MLKRDTFLAGFIIGVFLPAMIFVILHETGAILESRGTMTRNFSIEFKCIISVFVNIVPFILFNKAAKGNAMRGIMTITFIYAFAVVIYLYI